MRKPASILSFMLGLGLLIAWISMSYSDGKNAANDISSGFAEMGTPAFDEDMRQTEKRHDDERLYGFGGAIFFIAGLALWPRVRANSPSNLAVPVESKTS